MKHEAKKLESTISLHTAQSVSKLTPGKAKYFPTYLSASFNENDRTFHLANELIDYIGDETVLIHHHYFRWVIQCQTFYI